MINEEVLINQQLQYVEVEFEKSTDLTLQKLNSLRWQRVSKKGFAKPAAATNYILRLDFCKLTAGIYHGIINSNSNHLTIHQSIDNGKLIKIYDTDTLDSSQPYAHHRYPVFTFQNEYNQDFSLFISLYTKGGNVRIPMTLLSHVYLSNKIIKDEGTAGLLYGLLIIMLIGATILGIAIGDINYFYYILIIVGLLLFLMTKFGHLYVHLWNRSMSINDTMAYFSMILHSIGLTAIAINVLKLRERSVALLRTIQITISIYVVIFILCAILYNFFPNIEISPFLKIAQLGGAIIPIMVVLVSLKIFFDFNSTEGLFLILSFSCSFILFIVYTLIPHGFFPVHSMQYTQWLPPIESVILLGVLGYNFNKNKNDLNQLQALSIESKEKKISDILNARKNERAKISTFLHNRIGIKMGAIRMMSDSDNDSLNTLIDDVSNDIRKLSHTLYSKILDEKGIISAMESEIAKIEDAYPHLKISVSSSLNPSMLKPQQQDILFQVFLEIIQNILKHGNAQNIWIELSIKDKEIWLIIEDDSNVLFEIDEITHGSGLKRIKSDLSGIDGTLSISIRKIKGMKHEIRINTNQE